MQKGLIFFCCACCLLILTVINLNIGPIVSGTVGDEWGRNNCAFVEDTYDNAKKNTIDDKRKKYEFEWNIDECKIKKGMYNLEYAAFIIDIIIGFVCGIMGLIHIFEGGKEHVSKTGIVGLGCGIVGFILTLVYAIFNGLVYTKYYEDKNFLYKRDSNGVFAEYEAGTDKYKCIYFDEEGNGHALIAKFSDLIEKQYNYDKDLFYKASNDIINCRYDKDKVTGNRGDINFNGIEPDSCSLDGHLGSTPGRFNTNCDKLYFAPENGFENKDKSDRFLTSLILSLFICLANIGLAIFGFLLFKNPSDFKKIEEMKN